MDQGRSRPEFVTAIYDDLQWLGIEWDDEPLIQSRRTAIYADGLEQLRQKGLVYACFCTRTDIASAMNAPHDVVPSAYPGTCRLRPDDPERRAREPHCWRLDSAKALNLAMLPEWTEADGRRFSASAPDFDDVVLARKDAPASYHLACVIDDSASGVNLVVRGADLRSSTPIQRLLQMLLGFPEPQYLHHLLVVNPDGRRLAKRDKAPTLEAIRTSGVEGRELAANLLAGKLPLGFAFGEG